MKNAPAQRSVEIGELVKVWPPKSPSWMHGIVTHREPEKSRGGSNDYVYTVFTVENVIIYPTRSAIWVDDEEPVDINVSFSSLAFPVIRKVMGGLLANQLVTIQPMTKPAATVFHMGL
jgi:hypothetical protein